jgi:hypothetical protein
VLNEVGFQRMFDQMMGEYLQPVAELAYPADMRKRRFVWQHTFLVRYQKGKEVALHTHAVRGGFNVPSMGGREFA